MRTRTFGLLFLLLFAAASLSARQTLPLADGWQFAYEADDWQSVTLPHTWNADDGTTPGYRRGTGVYRRTLVLSRSDLRQRLFLRFEGVSMKARVTVNGRLVGTHAGPFTAFCFEITDAVHQGSNLVEVTVSNAPDDAIAPLEGDFTIFGGIYRPVTLLSLPATCITPLDYGSSGLYLSSTLEGDDARLKARVLVDTRSARHRQRTPRVTVAVHDAQGRLVAESDAPLLAPSATADSVRTYAAQLTVPSVHRWDGLADPYLYTVTATVRIGRRVLDAVSLPTGFRSVSVDGRRGFFLNGHPYKLHGVNRHQDHAGKGWALTEDDHRQDMAIIRELGANALRLAHYPQSPFFYSLCDSAGLLVWAEVPLVGRAVLDDAFADGITLQLRELIRQNQHRPSIFCWGLFNELGTSGAEALVGRLNEVAHAEDPTRLTVAAPNAERRAMNDIPDLKAYNTYPGWYWADPDAMGPNTAHWNRGAGSHGIAVSEYGAGADVRHHDAGWHAPRTDGPFHPEEWQAVVHERNYAALRDSAYIWGSFVWNLFDFASAGRHEGGTNGMNDKGLIAYDRRTRKDAFWFYKAEWSPEPVVYVTSRRHDVRHDAHADIKVYSNQPDVVLTVNGTVVPQTERDGTILRYSHVPLRGGLNRIIASTAAVADTVEWLCDNLPELADRVNPLIGTAERGEGGMVPYVGTPYAMTKFVPQTRETRMGTAAYYYDDHRMIGFLASHQPAVWMGDYGYLSLMPQIDGGMMPDERAMTFSHDDEHATPYSYAVTLHDAQGRTITADYSAASRSAIYRFTFPEGVAPRLVVQGINLNPALSDWCNDIEQRRRVLKGEVRIDAPHRRLFLANPDRQTYQISPAADHFNGYYALEVDAPITDYGCWDEDGVYPSADTLSGTRMGAYLTFPAGTRTVTVRVASSFISPSTALATLQSELPGWDLDALKARTRARWNERLSAITVPEADDDDLAILYTALYHCSQFPSEFSEDGRYYSAFDDAVHDGISYNNYSLWDTFRAFHPLMTLLDPSLTSHWVTSLLQMYREGGWLPMWPCPNYTNIMIGTHADAFITDAYVKGVRDFDANLAWEALRKDAFTPPDADTLRRYGDRDRWQSFEGRAGATWYHALGYIPEDRTAESVSRTLEYTYDDWCVSRFAALTGHDAEARQLAAYSRNWRNLYAPDGFFLPRYADGTFRSLDDYDRTGLTEGSKWTYLFAPLHDIPALIDTMGGRDAFRQKLDDNFDHGHYHHDNEPGHHYAYLYNYIGEPECTQERVRDCMERYYHNAPDGLCGNDDCGQMSAWYLFSAMGFYPVTPGSDVYALGIPAFPRMTVRVDNHLLVVEARHWQPDGIVRQVLVDNKPLAEPFITHDALVNARTLTFVMEEKK